MIDISEAVGQFTDSNCRRGPLTGLSYTETIVVFAGSIGKIATRKNITMQSKQIKT